MFLAREMTAASFPMIGRHFGGRDHTTIIHGQRRIAALMRTSNEIPYHVEGVREIMGTLQPFKAKVAQSVSAGLTGLSWSEGRR